MYMRHEVVENCDLSPQDMETVHAVLKILAECNEGQLIHESLAKMVAPPTQATDRLWLTAMKDLTKEKIPEVVRMNLNAHPASANLALTLMSAISQHLPIIEKADVIKFHSSFLRRKRVLAQLEILDVRYPTGSAKLYVTKNKTDELQTSLIESLKDSDLIPKSVVSLTSSTISQFCHSSHKVYVSKSSSPYYFSKGAGFNEVKKPSFYTGKELKALRLAVLGDGKDEEVAAQEASVDEWGR
jgi:hypothetical protein